MKQRTRRYFTPSEMAVVWDRWQKGESLNAIARDLDRSHSTVRSGEDQRYTTCATATFTVVVDAG